MLVVPAPSGSSCPNGRLSPSTCEVDLDNATRSSSEIELADDATSGTVGNGLPGGENGEVPMGTELEEAPGMSLWLLLLDRGAGNDLG